MTDEELSRALDLIRQCVTLNSFGNFPTQREMLEFPEHFRYNINKTFESAINGGLVSIRSTNDYLLGPILGFHKIKVHGLAMSFNVLENVDNLLEVYNETKRDHYEHQDSRLDEFDEQIYLTTCYINVCPRDLEIPGFQLVDNKAIELCFKQARINAAQQGAFWGDEDLVINKLYKSEDGKEFIRMTNYYIQSAPQRSSDFNYIAGNRFSSPEEHIYLALLPTLSSIVKDRLCKEEIELFRILAEPYNLNSLAAKNRLKAVYALPIYADYISAYNRKIIKRDFAMYSVQRFEHDITATQRQIDRIVMDLEEAERRLQQLHKEKYYTEYQNEEINEQLEYILEHPYVKSTVFNYSNLIMNVRVPLSLWDMDTAETLLNNLENVCEHNNVSDSWIKYIRCFFEEVLIKQTATCYMSGIVNIEAADYGWSYSNRNSVTSRSYLDRLKSMQAIYNPHIEHYNCQGTHKAEINKARATRDLIALFEALLNPLKNWNLTDGAVLNQAMSCMFPVMLNNDIECIEYNGEMITLRALYDKVNAAPVEETIEVDTDIIEAVEEGVETNE